MSSKGVMDEYKHQMDVAYNDPELRPSEVFLPSAKTGRAFLSSDLDRTLILADLWEAYLRN